MRRKLAAYVHLADGRVFGPDDEVPADAAAQITNPSAWATPPEGTPAVEGSSTPPGTAAGVPSGSAEGPGNPHLGPSEPLHPGGLVFQADTPAGDRAPDFVGPEADEPDPYTEPERPNKAGRNSSRAAWLVYADHHGVTLDSDATRDKIVEACRRAGVDVGD